VEGSLGSDEHGYLIGPTGVTWTRGHLPTTNTRVSPPAHAGARLEQEAPLGRDILAQVGQTDGTTVLFVREWNKGGFNQGCGTGAQAILDGWSRR